MWQPILILLLNYLPVATSYNIGVGSMAARIECNQYFKHSQNEELNEYRNTHSWLQEMSAINF